MEVVVVVAGMMRRDCVGSVSWVVVLGMVVVARRVYVPL